MAFAALFGTPLSEVIPKAQQLISIDSTTTLLGALQELANKNVYSAPVKDKSNGNYYGFLDLIDIVVYLVDSIEQKKSQQQGAEHFKTLQDWVNSLGLEKAKNLADISSKNPMVPLRPTDTIADALKVFESTGTHRVPILSGNNVAEIVNVLTQVDVISWLLHNMKSIHPDARKKTLQELHVEPKNVISVNIGTPVFDAFKLMVENKITAVAVLNPDGTLLSSLSAKDIKEVKAEELLTWMSRSTLEFIQMVRSRQINVSVPAFAIHFHHTLEDVVSKLSILRVHRLYITDASDKPVGVLSLGDLFKILSSA